MQRREILTGLIALALVGLTGGSTELSAKPGRPASRSSVGGTRHRSRTRTRRRRRRRTIRRGMRLSSLPYGCNVTRIRGGVSYYYCGGIWYQPAYQGTTVVYIVQTIDTGANTDVEFEEDY
ncbi:MAG: hypothetical protein V7709_15305 [Halioglobus sp.]